VSRARKGRRNGIVTGKLAELGRFFLAPGLSLFLLEWRVTLSGIPISLGMLILKLRLLVRLNQLSVTLIYVR